MKEIKNYIWSGIWIGADMTVEERFAPIFRKKIIAEKDVSQARVYICGLGLFELKINGKLLDDSVLNPAHTQYNRTVLYRVFDASDFLYRGENIVTVELGNSFFNENGGVWNWQTASWRAAPKLIANIVIEYSDGGKETIATDATWEVTSDGPIISNGIYQGETYDARRAEEKYNWKSARPVDAPMGELKPQYMPPIRRIEAFKPKAITRNENGSVIITAPEMITGWARIRINVPEDTQVVITYAEQLAKDGHVRIIGKNEGRDGNWWPEYYIQQDCYISNGVPKDFEPKFSYKGFRYIQVDNYDNELSVDDITLYRVANDVRIHSEFRCSNELINKLHQLMRRTMLNNFQGKPTDTPVWEKNGWLGDANCALATMMYNFDMSTYLASFIDIMADCFREYGEVPVMVPSAAWGTENSPVWNTIFVFGAEALMNYCGCIDYVRSIYPDLKKFALKDVSELKENGWLWGVKGLADWVSPIGNEDSEADPNSSEGAEICGTSFIYGMLKSMVSLAERLDEKEDVKEYQEAMAHIYKAFNNKFYKPDFEIYETSAWTQRGERKKYRQTSNLVPLAFGLVPEENKDGVLRNLIKDIVERGYHLDTGCTGTKFVLPVLFDNGYYDVAYKVLTQTTYPGWGFWIEQGADSAWESWEKTTRSMNHYFLGTFDEALYSHLAGIRNIKDGYRSFTVKPILDCDIEYVRAKIDSPQGKIRCEWHKTAHGVEVEIEVPQGCVADICLEYCGEKIQTILSGGIRTYKISNI